MNVSELMTSKPVTIGHGGTLGQALEIMGKVGCRHLPVISTDGHLVGIVSDRDCRMALDLPGSKRTFQQPMITEKTLVSSIMTPAPVIIEEDVPAHEAARLVLTHRISSLPVMRDETLIGIITTSDLLVAFMSISKQLDQAT
jgi:acetoin utilization protein AcuB